jgi:hypothetical protein
MTPVSPFAEALTKQVQAPKPTRQTKITVTRNAKPEVKTRYASAYLIIKDNTVFVPSNGKTSTGLSVDISPVYSIAINDQSLLGIIEKVLKSPRKKLTSEQSEELLRDRMKKTHPVLRATHSSSWRNLYKTAAFYSIQTIENETKWLLFLHNPNPQKNNSPLEFPISTPLEELVKIILEDVKMYPHVLKNLNPREALP